MLRVESSFDCCLKVKAKSAKEDVDRKFIERKNHPGPVVRRDAEKFLVVLDQIQSICGDERLSEGVEREC